MAHDATASVVPVASIQVDDVDSAYEVARAAGAEIVHDLTTEPWGYGGSSSGIPMAM